MSNEFKYIFKLPSKYKCYIHTHTLTNFTIFHFVQLFRKTENTRNHLFESKVLFSLIVILM